jgi:hypothetical protein
MTKVDLLTHFDDIVTDGRLSLRMVEDHLDHLTSDAYLLGEYHAIASGGSSGVRGVYVYDWAGWTTYFLSAARGQAHDRLHDPRLADAPPVEAIVAADKPSHGSSALSQTFSNPQVTIERVPITLPIDEVVARLNNLAPTTLRGYPSAWTSWPTKGKPGAYGSPPCGCAVSASRCCPRSAPGCRRRGTSRYTASGLRRRPARWATPAGMGAACTLTTTW